MDDESTPEELARAEDMHAQLPEDVRAMLDRGMRAWEAEVESDYDAAFDPLLKVFAAKPREDDKKKKMAEDIGPPHLTPFGNASYIPDDFYELLSEAGRAGLVKKVITDRNGHKRTVYVRSGEDAKKKIDPKLTKADPEEIKNLLAKGIADANSLSPEEFQKLGGALMSLKADQLKSLAKQYGEKVGGAKQVLADRLTAKVKAARAANPVTKPGTAHDKLAAILAEHPEHADAIKAAMAKVKGAESPKPATTQDFANDPKVKVSIGKLNDMADDIEKNYKGLHTDAEDHVPTMNRARAMADDLATQYSSDQLKQLALVYTGVKTRTGREARSTILGHLTRTMRARDTQSS